ncbi:hypothetical protein CBR_g22060 [Chara braunii]|uniref:CBS domain-containing protein n=1 Tax=Chara braunii TaxID=69332 RepID=A0A388L258_CHABU|nr:hypothetical protein CBR_g22060 [Chara braunii]|eukprot:GBG76312.1 hypothetical protein CBR_g22060 [Chara braunii]
MLLSLVEAPRRSYDSDLRWQDPLVMEPVDGHEGVFSIVIDVPPGYVQYKFIVDDEWRHDDDQQLMPDPLGHLNNWKFVKEDLSEEVLLPLPVPPASHQQLMEIDSRNNSPAMPGMGHIPAHQPDLKSSRMQIADFLAKHTAYELLPESSKVVALDVTLPVKQAFHALHDQGIPAAPLWDSARQQFVGMLSASDFITILRQLGSNGASLSEEELETHTIAAWKEEKALQSSEIGARRPLIYAGPDDSLRTVADKLLQHGVATLPVLSISAEDGNIPRLLHLASLSGVLKCLTRNFYNFNIPIFTWQIGALPIGTWAGPGKGGRRPLSVLKANASLSSALTLLLEAGVSSLPVVDDNGALVDVYARSDITALAKDRAYTRLQLDDITVSQALMYRQDASGVAGTAGVRCHYCLCVDTLRQVMERLAQPGVRRLICIEAGSKRVEGIISLRDIFSFLLS